MLPQPHQLPKDRPSQAAACKGKHGCLVVEILHLRLEKLKKEPDTNGGVLELSLLLGRPRKWMYSHLLLLSLTVELLDLVSRSQMRVGNRDSIPAS